MNDLPTWARQYPDLYATLVDNDRRLKNLSAKITEMKGKLSPVAEERPPSRPRGRPRKATTE